MSSDKDKIYELKKYFFDNAFKYKVSHLPSALSALDILYVLYNKIVNITKENASDVNRDRVIISKEHCRWAQVCVLVDCGLLDEKYIPSFKKDGGALGHDMYNLVSDEHIDAVDVATGSLGHGPGVGAGLAWNSKHNVYVIVGDGELQEGSVWEAIMFAGHHNLRNLTIILDRNQLQIDDYTKNIINSSDNAKARFESFGFKVIECDGHDTEQLEKAFKQQLDCPKCIIANTIKGKEIDFIREEVGAARFHWSILRPQDYERLKKEFYNEQ